MLNRWVLGTLTLLVLLTPGLLTGQEEVQEGEDIIVLKTDGQVVVGDITDNDGKTVSIRIKTPPGEITFLYDEIDSINEVSAERIMRLQAIASEQVEEVRKFRRLDTSAANEPAVMAPPVYGDLRWRATRDSIENNGVDWESVLVSLNLGQKTRIDEFSRLVAVDQRAGDYDWTSDALYLLVEKKKYGKELKVVDDGVITSLGSSLDEFILSREIQTAGTWHTFRKTLLARDHGMLDDRTLAMRAIVEGLSILGATDLTLREVGLDVGRFMSVDDFADLVGDSRGSAYENDQLHASYTRDLAEYGAHFAHLYYGSGGWTTLNRILTDPPGSTEMLLHPEKYGVSSRRDFPVRVSVDSPLVALGPGFKQRADFVAGELTLRHYLMLGNSEADAIKAAAGWGGDTCMLYSSGLSTVTLLVTTWDSAQDATEFKAAATRRLSAKGPQESIKEPGRDGQTPRDVTYWDREAVTFDYVHGVSDRVVVVVEGVPAAQVKDLVDHLATAKFEADSGAGVNLAISPETWEARVEQLRSYSTFWNAPYTPPVDLQDMTPSKLAKLVGASAFTTGTEWELGMSNQAGPSFPIRIANPSEAREVFFGLIEPPFEVGARGAAAVALFGTAREWDETDLSSIRTEQLGAKAAGLASFRARLREGEPMVAGRLLAVPTGNRIAVFVVITGQTETARGEETLQQVLDRISW